MLRVLATCVSAAVICVACGSEPSMDSQTPSPTSASPSLSPTPSPSISPSAAPTPTVRLSAPPSPRCINGWVQPRKGTPLRSEPLDIIRGQMGVSGLFLVEEMRYFTGPEAPGIVDPRPPVVKRWYVKAYLAEKPSFRGRWLIEKRSAQIKGISAVAPFDTTGFRSPDWRGFVGEGPPTSYPGLPGKWIGINYDFVTGEGDAGFPGLPRRLVGCLRGT